MKKFQPNNQPLNSKSLIVLFSVAVYGLYLSICFGYFLSKISYNFFDEINKHDISKMIQFRKKFNFKKIKKFVLRYILKFFKNWINRIIDKYHLLGPATHELITLLKIFRKKFKSIFRFKYNFRQLERLLLSFWMIYQVFVSFFQELFFIHGIIDFLIGWKWFLLMLMAESILITSSLYLLCLILLWLFGLLFGFLLGIYSRKNDIYVLTLIRLLQYFSYNNGFNYDLSEFNKVDQFSKFSFKTIEQIKPRPSRISFKEPPQIPLPFLIIEDPLVFIETEVLSDKSTNYEFELFKFYLTGTQKVKS